MNAIMIAFVVCKVLTVIFLIHLEWEGSSRLCFVYCDSVLIDVKIDYLISSLLIAW